MEKNVNYGIVFGMEMPSDCGKFNRELLEFVGYYSCLESSMVFYELGAPDLYFYTSLSTSDKAYLAEVIYAFVETLEQNVKFKLAYFFVEEEGKIIREEILAGKITDLTKKFLTNKVLNLKKKD